MKTLTITAVAAMVIALPLFLGKRKPSTDETRHTRQVQPLADEDLRYAIDDFLT